MQLKSLTKKALPLSNAFLNFGFLILEHLTFFLSDNGREFDNKEFQDMAQNLNVVVRTTAAQSPWHNGLSEHHNAVLGDMVTKTLTNVKCNFEVALG